MVKNRKDCVRNVKDMFKEKNISVDMQIYKQVIGTPGPLDMKKFNRSFAFVQKPQKMLEK